VAILNKTAVKKIYFNSFQAASKEEKAGQIKKSRFEDYIAKDQL
jgi:hypothetical protein